MAKKIKQVKKNGRWENMGRDASVKTNLVKKTNAQFDGSSTPYLKYIEYSVEADYDTKIATIESGLGYSWQSKAQWTSSAGTEWMIVVKDTVLGYFDGAEQATFKARPDSDFFDYSSGLGG